MENDLNKLANILDAKISLSFNEIKTQKNLFDNAKFDFIFRKETLFLKQSNYHLTKLKLILKVEILNIKKIIFFFMI